jgi:hypothetical protein
MVRCAVESYILKGVYSSVFFAFNVFPTLRDCNPDVKGKRICNPVFIDGAFWIANP